MVSNFIFKIKNMLVLIFFVYGGCRMNGGFIHPAFRLFFTRIPYGMENKYKADSHLLINNGN